VGPYVLQLLNKYVWIEDFEVLLSKWWLIKRM